MAGTAFLSLPAQAGKAEAYIHRTSPSVASS